MSNLKNTSANTKLENMEVDMLSYEYPFIIRCQGQKGSGTSNSANVPEISMTTERSVD